MPKTLAIKTRAELHRQLLLYWDQIVYLNHNEQLKYSKDDHFLRAHGFLDELGFTFDCGGLEQFHQIAATVVYGHTLEEAFRLVSTRREGFWSYLEPTWENYPSLNPLPSSFESIPAIELKLMQLLPVPGDEVPFADILEFKRKRTDELQCLRFAIDELVNQARQAAEPLRGLERAVWTVSKSLTDIRRAASRSLVTRLLGEVRIQINVATLATGASVGATVAPELFHLPATVGAAAGVVAAAVSAELTYGSRLKGLPKETLAFKYALDAEREIAR